MSITTNVVSIFILQADIVNGRQADFHPESVSSNLAIRKNAFIDKELLKYKHKKPLSPQSRLYIFYLSIFNISLQHLISYLTDTK